MPNSCSLASIDMAPPCLYRSAPILLRPERASSPRPRHVATGLDPPGLDHVRVVRRSAVTELEDAGGEPGDGQGGDGAGDRDQRLDRRHVAQRLEVVAVEDEPDDRRRELV